MDNDGREYEQDVLSEVLGVDNKTGFHIEMFGQVSLFWDNPRRGDGSRYPCLGPGNVYSGCVGAACDAPRCWAGRLVPSAVQAASVPLPTVERRGAQCHVCALATDTAEGLVTCAEAHFDRPISVAALLRQRIPEAVPLPCPDFQRAEELRPELIALRRAKRNRGARRGGREAE
ncbi:MAG TPA: hypothetical protein VFB34_07250 [Chloroflexota bacterium]|nr:hypothetical protein [Chloroflexota bacterium]